VAPVRRGQWQSVHTDEGWHLRLVAANGEIVLTSKVFTRKEAVLESFGITLNSSVMALRDIDERRTEDDE
jgi:uncharacterized protein YegP (UPF0339 family)